MRPYTATLANRFARQVRDYADTIIEIRQKFDGHELPEPMEQYIANVAVNGARLASSVFTTHPRYRSSP